MLAALQLEHLREQPLQMMELLVAVARAKPRLQSVQTVSEVQVWQFFWQKVHWPCPESKNWPGGQVVQELAVPEQAMQVRLQGRQEVPDRQEPVMQAVQELGLEAEQAMQLRAQVKQVAVVESKVQPVRQLVHSPLEQSLQPGEHSLMAPFTMYPVTPGCVLELKLACSAETSVCLMEQVSSVLSVVMLAVRLQNLPSGDTSRVDFFQEAAMSAVMLTLEATLATVSWSRQKISSWLGWVALGAPLICRRYRNFSSSWMIVFKGSLMASRGKSMVRLVSRSQSTKKASTRFPAVAPLTLGVKEPITMTLVRLEETQNLGAALNWSSKLTQARRLPLPSSLRAQRRVAPVLPWVEVITMRLRLTQILVSEQRGGVLLLGVKQRVQVLLGESLQSSLPLTRLVRLPSAAVQVSTAKSFITGRYTLWLLGLCEKMTLSALNRSQFSEIRHLVAPDTVTFWLATAACTSATFPRVVVLGRPRKMLMVVPSPSSLQRSFWAITFQLPGMVASVRSMLLGALRLGRTAMNLVSEPTVCLKVQANLSTGMSVAVCGMMKEERGGATVGTILVMELRLPKSNSSTSQPLVTLQLSSTISLLVMLLSTKILWKSVRSRPVSSLARRRMIWLPTNWQASSQGVPPGTPRSMEELRKTRKQSLKSKYPTPGMPLMVVRARTVSWKMRSVTVLRVQSTDLTTMRLESRVTLQLKPILVIWGEGKYSTGLFHCCRLTKSIEPSCRKLLLPSSFRKQTDCEMRQLVVLSVVLVTLLTLWLLTSSLSRTCRMVQPCPGFMVNTIEQSLVVGLYLYTLPCTTPYIVDSVIERALKPGGRVMALRLSLFSLSLYSIPDPSLPVTKKPALQFSPRITLSVKVESEMLTKALTSSGKRERGALAIMATLPASLLKQRSPKTLRLVSQTRLQERVSLVPPMYCQVPLSVSSQTLRLLAAAERLKKLNLKTVAGVELTVAQDISMFSMRLEPMKREPAEEWLRRTMTEEVMAGGGAKLGAVALVPFCARQSESTASSRSSCFKERFSIDFYLIIITNQDLHSDQI